MSAAPVRQARPVSRSHAPATTPTPQPRRRDHLHAVSTPEQARSLMPFATLCVAIIVAALAGVLILNTTMASGAYERRDMKIELAELHQQRAALLTALEANSAPQHLSTTAEELGMVPAGTLGFVTIEDNVVIEQGGDR